MNAYSKFDAQDKAIKAKVLELMKNCSDYIKRTGKLSNDEWNEEQMKRGEIRYAIASCERKLKTLYEREQTEDVIESIEWYEKARCQYKESEIMMNLGIYRTIEPYAKGLVSKNEVKK